MTTRTAIVAFAIVLTAGSVVPHTQGGSVKSEQDVLVALERQWNAAFYIEKDLKFIERLLADDYMAVYDDGSRGDKARELEDARTFDQQVDSAVQEDFRVKMDGDTAIVWFTLRLVGPVQGQTVQSAARYVDVFSRRDNQWQCIFSQSTKVLARP